ncbi:uncharacterized protein [Euphorbia lathyris]|uniref:uncharacterized protein n=1 Tax=Euphorbia lathyris TaxID=212925 RepID=UPI003313A8E2
MAFPQFGGQVKLDEYRTDGHSTHEEEKEPYNVRVSVEKLSAQSVKENERKANLLQKNQQLRERIKKEEGTNAKVQKLVPLLQSLKAVERDESVSRSNCEANRSQLEARVHHLEDKIVAAWDDQTLSEDLDNVLAAAVEKLDSTKEDLAAWLRAVLSVKQQIDNVPTQSELIQYERRFSELNVHIQEKHRQTRKYYATYNALLEIKELMLKETSLLNSISSQFQNAIASTDGHMKLIDSMDAIVKGSQQKLQKVEVGLQEEQKSCDALKKRYAAAMAEQRRCYSLLKAFQEECARNERLEKEIPNQNKATALSQTQTQTQVGS